MLKRPLCIYIDNSNIFIGGKEFAKNKHEDPAAFRLDFANFFHLVTGGADQFDEMVWAGSGDAETEKIFSALTQKGVKVLLVPVLDGGENETVDMAVQLNMYRHARKYRDSPGTMVLCTGDGKGYGREEGFLFDVEGFIADGWEVVLFSWDSVCHHGLKKFVQEKGTYRALEDYYAAITFIQDAENRSPFLITKLIAHGKSKLRKVGCLFLVHDLDTKRRNVDFRVRVISDKSFGFGMLYFFTESEFNTIAVYVEVV